jgi:hypothetical protein
MLIGLPYLTVSLKFVTYKNFIKISFKVIKDMSIFY